MTWPPACSAEWTQSTRHSRSVVYARQHDKRRSRVQVEGDREQHRNRGQPTNAQYNPHEGSRKHTRETIKQVRGRDCRFKTRQQVCKKDQPNAGMLRPSPKMKTAQLTKAVAPARIRARVVGTLVSAKVAISVVAKTDGTSPNSSIISAKLRMLADSTISARKRTSTFVPFCRNAGTAISSPKTASIAPKAAGIMPGPMRVTVPVA